LHGEENRHPLRPFNGLRSTGVPCSILQARLGPHESARYVVGTNFFAGSRFDFFLLTAGPLDLALLQATSARSALAHQLAEDLRLDFLSKFRHFLVAALRQNETLGTDGLKALYSEESRPEVVSALNALISEFNDGLKHPATRTRLIGEEEDESEALVPEPVPEKEEGRKKEKKKSTGAPVPGPSTPGSPPKDRKPKSGGKGLSTA
jgi:hypothetical protein